MDPIRLTKDIVDFFISASRAKSERTLAYLRHVCDACERLTEIDDVSADNGVLAHERVKRLYEDASSGFGRNFDPYGVFVIYNALSAARVYYWIRRWESESDARLELAAERNFREDLYEGSSPDTLAAEVTRFLDGDTADADKYRDALKSIKRECLASVAELSSYTVEVAAE